MTELDRTKTFFAEMEEVRQGIVHRLRAAGWSKTDAESEADEKLSEWDRERERKFQEKYRQETYTPEYIVEALRHNHFYLHETGFDWRLGCGIRSATGGIVVPTAAARKATKHPDVVKVDNGYGCYWIAREVVES